MLAQQHLKQAKIILTGGAGLVGQNLVVELKAQGYQNLVVLDKHEHNLSILQQLHPDVQTVLADLSMPGQWAEVFADAACLVMLQAQITGKNPQLFEKNTLQSTRHVLDAVHRYQVPYMVHISSSVVVSIAKEDDYIASKTAQEKMVRESGIPCAILRPTLMFGWFDPKHLGWLARFMEKTPIFPIPGHGRYLRQPLYNKDFCKIIIHCMEHQPQAQVFDVVGAESIDYIDIIRTIKRVRGLRTLIIKIPMSLFALLMRIYALFSKYPPFTVDQLKALTAGDEFHGVDTLKAFNVQQTPFAEAMHESFCDPRYSQVYLQRTDIDQL